jgi:hypothetical protein
MNRRAWATAAILGLATLGFARAGDVAWDRPETALARAAATGKPICYFFTQNEVTKEGGT